LAQIVVASVGERKEIEDEKERERPEATSHKRKKGGSISMIHLEALDRDFKYIRRTT
jgi:hypothetical protein